MLKIMTDNTQSPMPLSSAIVIAIVNEKEKRKIFKCCGCNEVVHGTNSTTSNCKPGII